MTDPTEERRPNTMPALLGAVAVTGIMAAGIIGSRPRHATATNGDVASAESKFEEPPRTPPDPQQQKGRVMPKTATRTKATVIAAAILALGWTGTSALAPERRHGEGPAFLASEPETPVYTIQPLRKLSDKAYPALVGAFDPGGPAKSTQAEDGRVVYEDARPAVMTVSWLEDGRPRRNDDGEVVGMRIEVPASCVPRARNWVGHALPVRETEWRLSNGDVRSLRDRKAVAARVCGGGAPDEAYDRANIAGG